LTSTQCPLVPEHVQDACDAAFPSGAVMSSERSRDGHRVSEEERGLLRRSVRDLLTSTWPGDRAVENAANRDAISTVWAAMARQGLASLGSRAADVGLREIVLVSEELGRASCPAPLLGAFAANLALAAHTSNAAKAFLADVHRGDATVALALGGFDGDAAAGGVVVRDGSLHGTLSFVEGAQTATHHLIFIDTPGGVAVVTADAPGATVRATPGLAVPPLCELAFANTPALCLGLPSESLADIALAARLACAGRALGAARRGFDLAVEHAKVRKQFGQFIGQFQAIQHKLADCLINLDGARLAIEAAADAFDRADPAWRVFANAAIAFAGPAVRAASVETHRALGAIGYAEEHEAPRHFRRVHVDLARFGGVQRARAQLADFLLGPAETKSGGTA
jgi:3-oxo-4-pregnene-20-carboxyl-CoA dehydrogenase beta subunit